MQSHLNLNPSVHELASLIRETVLSPLKGESQGACLYASFLFKEALDRFTKYESVIRGGGNGDGGIIDASGTLKGHYWVEALDPGNGKKWVIDLTADQFGFDDVVILPLSDAKRYVPGDQSEINTHVEEVYNDIANQ